MTQRIIPIVSPFFVREDELQGLTDVSELFDRKGPLALEIGCGTGHFILQLARQQPETNFLAIDIYNKGCYKTCRKLDLQAISNIRVLRMEARHFLISHIQPENLQAVYINCPDPWPKKRHRQRRLINTSFLELLRYYLKPGGKFYFCTDFADYALEVEALFPFIGFQNKLSLPYVHHLENYPHSKYMQRFLDKGEPLYFMVYQKELEFKPEKPTLPEPTSGFHKHLNRPKQCIISN